jgi:hypothetical protein
MSDIEHVLGLRDGMASWIVVFYVTVSNGIARQEFGGCFNYIATKSRYMNILNK